MLDRWTWLACGCLCAAVMPDASAEPFLVRNQHAVVALFGLPAPLPARLPANGASRLAAVVNWSNFETTAWQGDREYTLDGEVLETRVTYDRGFGERFALHGELAYRRLDAGTLDSAIEQFHDAFGLPNGSRGRLPEDALLLEYRVDGAAAWRIDDARSGVADLPLAFGYQWHATDAGALAAWVSVKLPTGSAEDMTGSGAADVALTLAAERQLAERWQVFGQANVAWLGDGDLLPALQQDVAGSVLAGLSWNAWRGLDLTAQIEANTAVLDSGVSEFDGAATVLTFGGSYRTTGGWRTDFGVSEDIDVDASPDVVFNFAVHRDF